MSRDTVSVYRFGCEGSGTLHVRTHHAKFETTHLGGDEYLFNGGVGGWADEAEAYLRKLPSPSRRTA